MCTGPVEPVNSVKCSVLIVLVKCPDTLSVIISVCAVI